MRDSAATGTEAKGRLPPPAPACRRSGRRPPRLLQRRLALLSEEAERDVQVPRRPPRHRARERAQPLDLGGHGPPRLLVQQQRHEQARHQRSSRRRSRSRADWLNCHLIASREPEKRKRLTSTPAGAAAAMNTVPTGLSGVPPSGPAIPVTARPHGDFEAAQMPRTLASATRAPTAPWARRR